MADDPNAGGNAAAGASGNQGTGEQGGAAGGTALRQNTGAGEAGAGASGAGEGGWPENWRELLAGDDAKELARLQRLATPPDLYKSYRQAENKLRSGQIADPLPDNPTDEEVAAYRKRMGIPEMPDGYGFAFPEALNAGDDDKAMLTAFQEHMHAANVPPGAAKAAFDFYLNQIGAALEQRGEAAQTATLESLALLRSEFKGREFDRNMKMADDFLTQHFGEDPESLAAVNTMLTMQLPNGVPLMYHAPFMRGLFKMARAYADDEALIGGDGAGGGKSIDDEYNELIKKSVSGKMSEAENARLNQLAEARVAREQKSGRRAA